MADISALVKKAILPAAVRTLLTREHLESGVSYNPISRKTLRDPYPLYDKLREKDPVRRMRLSNAWVLTRYEDVDQVMRDHRQFSRGTRSEGPFARGKRTGACSAWTLLTTRGSGHWCPRRSRAGQSRIWLPGSRLWSMNNWTGLKAKTVST